MKKFTVSYYERKKITVDAEDFRQAATMIPDGCQFITVGEDGAPVEDLMCVHSFCELCFSPLFGTVRGMVDEAFNCFSHISDQGNVPFVNQVCCVKCAIEKGIVPGA